MTWRRLVTALLGASVVLAAGAASADLLRLPRVRAALAELDLPAARAIVEGSTPDDRDTARAIALVALYDGDCERAAAALALFPGAEGGELGGADEVARGCRRATAGAAWVADEQSGIVVRAKHDADLPFVPLVAEVAEAARDAIERDLGAVLPRPLRVEIVPDQHSLALHTGLPEKAAQTTGTVAVAKWGKVTMLSPRAMKSGYGWADTLAHEITHLVVTRATHDKAPLWLQEGIAKREETRWRAAWPGDGVPSPEGVAKWGFSRGMALPLDRLGPSIAMLPSGEMAMVAYAEVHSFARYLEGEEGPGTLAKLLSATSRESGDEAMDRALEATVGAPLAALSGRWQSWVAGQAPAAAAELPVNRVAVFQQWPAVFLADFLFVSLTHCVHCAVRAVDAPAAFVKVTPTEATPELLGETLKFCV